MDEEQSLVPTETGLYDGAHYSLPEGLMYEDWQSKGSVLLAIHHNINWWIGDWILYGEQNYPDKYSQAVYITGKTEPTLRNCAWVASVFPPEERVYDDLTHTHYLEVAGIRNKEERHWFLRQASEHNLSALALRRLRAEELRPVPVLAEPDQGSRLVPAELVEAIEEFTSKVKRCPIAESTPDTEFSVEYPWGEITISIKRKTSE